MDEAKFREWLKAKKQEIQANKTKVIENHICTHCANVYHQSKSSPSVKCPKCQWINTDNFIQTEHTPPYLGHH